MERSELFHLNVCLMTQTNPRMNRLINPSLQYIQPNEMNTHQRLQLYRWYSVTEQLSIRWLSISHLSKSFLKLRILLILKSLLLPWPSPWNRQRRKIKNKTLRQTRWLHFSNSQIPFHQ